MLWIAVAAGGALGASFRYILQRLFSHVRTHLPWGTIIANVGASFVLGYAATTWHGMEPTATAMSALLATGIAGGLGTFSTFVHETSTLWRIGKFHQAYGNIATQGFGGLASAWLGMAVASGLLR